MDDNVWAAQRAHEVREKMAKEDLALKGRLLENDLKQREAPGLWNQFATNVKNKVGAFNAAFGSAVLEVRQQRPYELIVGNDSHVNSIIATFDREEGRISCSYVGTISQYTVEFVGNKVTLAKGTKTSTVYAVTTDEAATEFVDKIIELL